MFIRIRAEISCDARMAKAFFRKVSDSMSETSLKRNGINDFVPEKFLEIFAISLFQNNFEQMFLNFERNRKGNEEI